MPVVAEPQTPERLTRPFASHMEADGKLATPRDATLGNLVVDQYITMGANIAGAGVNRDMLVRAYKPTMCAPGGVGAIVAHAADLAVKAMSKEERWPQGAQSGPFDGAVDRGSGRSRQYQRGGHSR